MKLQNAIQKRDPIKYEICEATYYSLHFIQIPTRAKGTASLNTLSEIDSSSGDE